MEKDVTLNQKVQIASLPTENEECKQFGKTMDISGWGITWRKGETHVDGRDPNKPMYFEQECIDEKHCDIKTKSFNKNTMICVGDRQNPANSVCQGDSGGNI